MQDQPYIHGASTSSSSNDGSEVSVEAVPVENSTNHDVASLKRNLASNTSSSVVAQNGHSQLSNGSSSENVQGPPLITSPTDREIVRLVGQHLRDLGLIETVNTLIRESGCQLEHPAAARFHRNIIAGKWESFEQDLLAMKGIIGTEEKLTEMRFLILEQQYLELLEQNKVVEALRVLREKLSVLKHDTARLHQLSSFLMISDTQELRQAVGWQGVGAQSRQRLMEKLQGFLPPTAMLPVRRLESLLKQAVERQRDQCPFHNTKWDLALDSESLLSGHKCDKDLFPCKTYQILSDHCDEVWFCKFNHAGTLLATGSKESTVMVWEVNKETKRLHKKYTLEGHGFGASYFAWSPDDRYLAVVGPEDCCDMWIWSMEKGDLRHKLMHHGDDSLSCVAWYSNSQNLVCGGSKGQFYYCDVDGQVISSWEGVRIRSLQCQKDVRTVLAADTHQRIRAYTFDDMLDHTVIKEEFSIMNFTLDDSERYALVGVVSQGLHLWDLEDKCLVRRYRGCAQGYYSIYSCFGGLNQDLIASGSEDNNVYVWHRDKERPILSLSGHTGVVNAVSWNPSDPSMLVSCSDDGTVRVWGPAHLPSDGTSSGSDDQATWLLDTDRTATDRSCEVTSTTCGGQSSARSSDW